jgi:hypothetical protein
MTPLHSARQSLEFFRTLLMLVRRRFTFAPLPLRVGLHRPPCTLPDQLCGAQDNLSAAARNGGLFQIVDRTNLSTVLQGTM